MRLDSRHRAPKPLGVADIEPAAELPLYPGERSRDYSVRIYDGSPHDREVFFQTRVARPGTARPDWWAVLRDALNQVLPPPAKRKQAASTRPQELGPEADVGDSRWLCILATLSLM